MEKLGSLEISTGIGCPVGCFRFCPQEVTIKRYNALYGEKALRLMSIETFEGILEHTPKNVTLYFSGFFEPFANPNFVEMLKIASDQGHQVGVFTTLWGIKKEDIKTLAKIPLESVFLHIPDGKNMPEPRTENYRDLFFEFQTSVSRIHYMSMNEFFNTNNRENVVRGLHTKTKRYGYCMRFHDGLAPVVLPNGATFLCCNDFGLHNCVGNLLKDSYVAIKEKITKNEGHFKECQYCSWNEPLIGHKLSSTMNHWASIVKNI